jgi:hypothetical protein
MSDKQNDQADSTVLHLSQFAHGVADKPATAADSGATVIVKRAAAETVEKSGAPVVPKDGGAMSGKEMLGAVSYCYAKGVYESEEIERKMMKDPALRESVHGDVPDARAIRRFRALNRGAIQTTLEKAFGFLRRKEKADLMKPLPGQPAAVPPTSQAGESTVMYAREQAKERVQQAAFVDNMSKD